MCVLIAHTHTHTHTHAHTHAHTHTHKHTHTHAHTHTHKHTCTHTCTHIHMYTHPHMHTQTHTHTCTHTHAHTHAHRLQLEDPAVISSPDELKQQLKQWLHELDKFRRHAQSGMESKQPDSGMGTEQHTPELEPRQLLNSSTDIFRSSCYQCLQDSAMAAVTELATLCAELDVFISSEGLDSMRALLASCLSVVDGWRVRVAVGEREWAERRRLWSLMGEREIGKCLNLLNYTCRMSFHTHGSPG